MIVKDYEEAKKAIEDIVFKAKVPIITMVAILEIVKHQLLTEHILDWKAETTLRAFKALQKKAEENSAGKGVS